MLLTVFLTGMLAGTSIAEITTESSLIPGALTSILTDSLGNIVTIFETNNKNATPVASWTDHGAMTSTDTRSDAFGTGSATTTGSATSSSGMTGTATTTATWTIAASSSNWAILTDTRTDIPSSASMETRSGQTSTMRPSVGPDAISVTTAGPETPQPAGTDTSPSGAPSSTPPLASYFNESGYSQGAITTTMTVSNTTVASSGPQRTHAVQVGKQSQLLFDPDQIAAAPGDVVAFQFHRLNHTVTESSLYQPCEAAEGGFDTGFHQFNPTDGPDDLVAFEVGDTAPRWFFCRQGAPKSHCRAGMVFAINPGGAMNAFLDNARPPSPRLGPPWTNDSQATSCRQSVTPASVLSGSAPGAATCCTSGVGGGTASGSAAAAGGTGGITTGGGRISGTGAAVFAVPFTGRGVRVALQWFWMWMVVYGYLAWRAVRDCLSP